MQAGLARLGPHHVQIHAVSNELHDDADGLDGARRVEVRVVRLLVGVIGLVIVVDDEEFVDELVALEARGLMHGRSANQYQGSALGVELGPVPVAVP
ncbi:hypothetical protein TKK_0008769 [Trichogramma kaykai]